MGISPREEELRSILGTPGFHTGSAQFPTLAIIIGSIRPDRFGPRPASWLAEEAQLHGSFDVDLIDLGDYALPMELQTL